MKSKATARSCCTFFSLLLSTLNFYIQKRLQHPLFPPSPPPLSFVCAFFCWLYRYRPHDSKPKETQKHKWECIVVASCHTQAMLRFHFTSLNSNLNSPLASVLLHLWLTLQLSVMWPFYSQTIDWLAIIGEGERRESPLWLGELLRWWDLLTWVEMQNMTGKLEGKPFGCRWNFFFPCRLEICNLLWMHNYDVWATWEYVTLSARSSHTFRHRWYWNTFMFSSRTVTNNRNSQKCKKCTQRGW